MTSNYEDFGPLKVGKKVKVKVETNKYDLEITIDKYKIVYNAEGFDCCNWADAVIKRTKIMSLWGKKTFDVGYVKEIKLDFGKDIVQEVSKKTGKIWEHVVNGKIIQVPETYYTYKILKEKDLSEDWWLKDPETKTGNVFTLTLNKNTKLLFFNGNNEGYYNWDFLIYEGDKLLFKSSL